LIRAAQIGLVCLLLLATGNARRARHVSYRAFPPTRQSLIDQNEEANRRGLPRIADDKQLRSLIQESVLVQIVPTDDVKVHIPTGRDYAQPWAVAFLKDLAADYRAVFGVPLQVNSAVRTVKFQKHLRLWNRNAAPATGDLASVHLAGIAIDLQRRGLTGAQVRWLQLRLLYYHARGLVIVEEELRRNECIHVVVRAEYPATPAANAIVVEMPVPSAELLPVDIRDFPQD
jgi:hypothetical protein